jgi:hypothetical protein
MALAALIAWRMRDVPLRSGGEPVPEPAALGH